MMATQKRKAIPATDRKEKKAATATVTKHILHCSKLGYPEDEGRRDILKKNL
jgi:hypothetical protein